MPTYNTNPSSASIRLNNRFVNMSKLPVPRNVGRRVEARPLLLPERWVRARALDLKAEEFALALEEPGAEAADFL